MTSWRSLVLRVWLIHAGLSALLWWWAFGVAMGLGFKDQSRWTLFDRMQASLVPNLAFVLTMPGRLVLDWTQSGSVVATAWVLNSLFWAVGLVAVFGLLKRALSRP